MKAMNATILLVGLSAASCSQNEKPAATQPSDYAENYEELIQNPEKDSASNDTVKMNSTSPAALDSTMPKK